MIFFLKIYEWILQNIFFQGILLEMAAQIRRLTFDGGDDWIGLAQHFIWYLIS